MPKKVEALEGVKIVQAACGASHTLALDDEGYVYSFGSGAGWFSGVAGVLGHGDNKERLVPTRIEALAEDGNLVTAVEAGNRHSVFLTKEKDVYCCGVGEFGRLGNAGSYDQLVPAPVEFPIQGQAFRRIRSGSSYSMAETASGEILAWGKNDQGQLGQGASLSMDIYCMESIPVVVGYGIEGLKMKDLAAGYNHAVALDEDGHVWLWGMRLHVEPYQFTEFNGKSICKVAGGQYYTAAVSEDGNLFTMGQGSSWCLGHGDKKSLTQPQQVMAFAGQKVLDVFCGERHMAAIVEDAAAPEDEPKSAA